jgi:hypothetical protein
VAHRARLAGLSDVRESMRGSLDSALELAAQVPVGLSEVREVMRGLLDSVLELTAASRWGCRR